MAKKLKKELSSVDRTVNLAPREAHVYMALRIQYRFPPDYDLSLGTSFAKVDRLIQPTASDRQTLRKSMYRYLTHVCICIVLEISPLLSKDYPGTKIITP